MAKTNNAVVLDFPKKTKQAQKRKRGVNVNKDGSVRNINGKIYVDFYYLSERIRESSGLPYTEANFKTVRDQFDRITVGIKTGTFRFAEVSPHSKKAAYFAEKEREVFKLKYTPEQINCGEYFQQWYDLLKNSGRVTGRTLLGYKSILKMYLTPFFGKMSFGDLNLTIFTKFIVWARQQKLRGKQAGNETINKCFVPLKSICKSAALESGWGGSYDPFAGFKKLPESDAYEKILPFSLEEQQKLIAAITDHWHHFSSCLCDGIATR
jgi:integrase